MAPHWPTMAPQVAVGTEIGMHSAAPKASLKRLGDKYGTLQRMGKLSLDLDGLQDRVQESTRAVAEATIHLDNNGLQDRVQESTRAVAEVTIRRQLRNVFHPSMIAVVAGACCCTSLMMYGFDPDSARQMEWHDFVQNTGAQVANSLGGLQAFLLAFRLNVCYQGSHSPCTPHCRCALF